MRLLLETKPKDASRVRLSYGFAGLADTIPAINIGRRAAVYQPYCTEATGVVAPEQSPSA